LGMTVSVRAAAGARAAEKCRRPRKLGKGAAQWHNVNRNSHQPDANMNSHSRPVKRRRAAPRPPDAAAESLPAKQTRSRETLGRLLDAAEALLVEGGLERATVPNIAARAGLSVGVVYRRFPDKDALLRAVYERFFERAQANNARGIEARWWDDISLADMARTLIGSLVSQHRRNRELLRALWTYTQTASDADFRRRVDALNADTMHRLGTLLLTRRYEIRHPDADHAVVFGLFMVASTLRSVMLADSRALRPFSVAEATLGDELTRMYLAYLDVRGKPTFNRALHGQRGAF
jgi:AcrR family transcriptional regulator